MNPETETSPLLHNFERDSWRNSARKRCFRMPSEITITGVILGLFLVVVTSLLLLENLKSTKEKGLEGTDNLLASPFKYSKKAVDPSWEDKREAVRDKKSKIHVSDPLASPFKYNKLEPAWQNKRDAVEAIKARKWDLINAKRKLVADKTASPLKGKLDSTWQNKKDAVEAIQARKWDLINAKRKLVADKTGFLLKSTKEDQLRNWNDEDATDDVPNFSAEYGRDESWEIPLQQGMSKLDSLKDLNEDEAEIKKIILSSKLNLEDIDEGWKTLSEQGWKDKEIRKALFKALKARKKELMGTPDDALQSPLNLDDILGKFKDSWKENLHKGDKEVERQKNIGDEWKSKINLLQSPKSKEKKKQKDKDESLDEGTTVADMSGDLNKGQVAQIMNLIETSKAKWKKIDEGWKNLSEQGWKEKEIRRALLKALLNRNAAANDSSILQSPMKIEQVWDEIKGFWNNLLHKGDGETGQQSINDDWKNKMSAEPLQSSYKKWKKERDQWKKYNKGWKNKDNEDTLTDAVNDTENSLQSPMYTPSLWEKLAYLVNSISKKGSDKTQPKQMDTFQSPKKWKKKHEKETQSDQTASGKQVEVALILALKETEKLLQVPEDFERFLDDIIQIIKDLQTNQTNSREEESDEEVSEKEDITLQRSMPSVYMKWKERDNEWKKINKGVPVPLTSRCPMSKAHREFLTGSPVSDEDINCALIAEKARKELGQCIDLSFLPKPCKPTWRFKCFSLYKYRTTEGTCNNRIHPTWGKSGIPFVRMIAPDYADGASELRKAKNGEPLPNARFASRKLYSERRRPDQDTTVLFLYFGLLVDHDMIGTLVESESIPCCNEDHILHPETRSTECIQIDVPDDDPFYGPRNVKCLNLVRSVPVIGKCPGRREQMNKVTSYLDGSAVYGSTMQQTKHLRTFTNGQLQTQIINDTPFMGISKGSGLSCGTPQEPLHCFEAGDSRVNMMVELTAMHTVWYREHNRIATELHKLNSNWTDETLFQEARRILIGELQHITYKEYLPLLLGEKAIEEFELKINETQEYNGYDDTIDATVFNVLAAAAFRFGHSLAPDMQYLQGGDNSTLIKIPLHETFFNANLLYHSGLDLLLRGAAMQRTQTVDSYITPEVREHLFQSPNVDYGHDLAAVGIQRCRDHGLPPYTKWRAVCGLSEVKAWEDLYSIMDKERADMFQEVYLSVDDIDLIPGALAENHIDGSLLGPTYTCLIGRQFKKTRKGDRFWFEQLNEIGSFTKGQLDEIYKSNMARILCDNSDNITAIQRKPFKVPSDDNPVLDCSTMPKVDLSKWIA